MVRNSLGLDKHNTGASSEMMVAGYLQAEGYDVFLPICKKSRCDLIYLDEGRPVRVQVKTGTTVRTGPYRYEQVRLRARDTGTVYAPDEIDELWVVGTNLWRIPAEVASNRTSLYLRTDNPAPRTSGRTYRPEDYEVRSGTFDSPYRDRLTA